MTDEEQQKYEATAGTLGNILGRNINLFLTQQWKYIRSPPPTAAAVSHSTLFLRPATLYLIVSTFDANDGGIWSFRYTEHYPQAKIPLMWAVK